MNSKNITENTCAGAIAPVATPLGAPIKRSTGSNLLKGIKTSKKYVQEGTTHDGKLSVNMGQMKKWKVDQDNVKYYDSIMKSKGSVHTLDARPYIEYLNEFGVFYTFYPSLKESSDVTDFNPKSAGGTRKELLKKYAKSKAPADATAARKAGATQKELSAAVSESFNFDVDHMNGSRGIGLDSADTRQLADRDWEMYGNYDKWLRDVKQVNTELLDGKATTKKSSNGTIVLHNGVDFAWWSERNGNGQIDIRAAKKSAPAEVKENTEPVKNQSAENLGYEDGWNGKSYNNPYNRVRQPDEYDYYKTGYQLGYWEGKNEFETDSDLDETIVKTGNEYELKSHTGKNLGKYPTKAGAEKRERQVNYFKHRDLEESDKILAPGQNKRYPNLVSKTANTIKMDVPFLIRLMEYCREELASDIDLHKLSERIIQAGVRDRTLNMSDYEKIMNAGV